MPLCQEPSSVAALGAQERTCQAAVAYELMRDIVFEDPGRPAPSSPDFRRYLLDLYAECLLTVQGKRTRALQRVVAAAAPKTAQRSTAKAA